ncbi:MAG: LuxR C-terminal-related transcriptional regulator [Micromonosporaceae bacterium]
MLICDKLLVVRSGLRALLDAEPDIDVVGTTDSGTHGVMLTRSTHPDVVVTGLDLLNLTGIDLTRQLTRQSNGFAPRVVVYVMSGSDEGVNEVLHAGASGVLINDGGREQLVSAIRAVARGETMLAPAVAQRLVDWFRRSHVPPDAGLGKIVATLTAREREVLALLAEGLQPEEIARKLFVELTTVRTHIYRLRGKLDLKDRAQIVSFAFRAGVIRPAWPAASESF